MSLESMSVDELVGDNNEEIENIEESESIDEVDDGADYEDLDEEDLKDKPRLYKVKVDGVESEVSEDELVKNYQLEQASRKRLEQSSKQLKTLTEALQVGRDNPSELLEWLGIDIDDFLRDQVRGRLDDAKLSPEQRELRDLRAMREQQEIEAQEAKLRSEKEQYESQYEQVGQQLETEILEAIDNRKLSKTLVSDVARIMLLGLDRGKPITAKEAVEIALKDTSSRLQTVLSDSDEDFIDNLPRDVQDKIRRKLMAKAQAPRIASPRNDKAESKSKKKSSKFDELFGGSRTI